MTEVKNFKEIFVDGQFVKPISTEKLEISGEDGKSFSFPNGSVEDLEKAVHAAQEALSSW